MISAAAGKNVGNLVMDGEEALSLPRRLEPLWLRASQEGATPKPGAVAGPMWRPRNAGLQGGTMSSNLLCSSKESAANRSKFGIPAPAASVPHARRLGLGPLDSGPVVSKEITDTVTDTHGFPVRDWAG